MATFSQWLTAARPQTLPAALAPVAAGTGAAAALDGAHVLRALLALVVALALQIGVNYANDYSDGIRGTDDDRIGPFRLTGSKAASPGAVLAAMCLFFAVALAAGVWLLALCGHWWLLVVGAACIPAAWFYTGGKRPYGYRGYGEVFVFLFFGLVAVLGTTYSQADRISFVALWAAIGIGALACALLVTNNLRDIESDANSGKYTLTVRLGDGKSRAFYLALVGVALLMVVFMLPRHPWAWLVFCMLPLLVRPVRAVLSGAAGSELLPVLRDTGKIELLYGLLLGLSLSL
ncbi:1,4-dihydroxy-2-naphthoate polyprenyltransferase [Desulfovibrio sp. JY]|nr:1,4-dihydroxy-2-naphthoate polyprenyltransferase [Desulfovibrio sp. JY]